MMHRRPPVFARVFLAGVFLFLLTLQSAQASSRPAMVNLHFLITMAFANADYQQDVWGVFGHGGDTRQSWEFDTNQAVNALQAMVQWLHSAPGALAPSSGYRQLIPSIEHLAQEANTLARDFEGQLCLELVFPFVPQQFVHLNASTWATLQQFERDDLSLYAHFAHDPLYNGMSGLPAELMANPNHC